MTIDLKKSISVLLLAAMLCGLMPLHALAEEYSPEEPAEVCLEETEMPEALPEEQPPVEIDEEPADAGDLIGEDIVSADPADTEPEASSEEPEPEEAINAGDDGTQTEEGIGDMPVFVAYVTDTDDYYTSLADAIDAVSSSGEIKLINDCTVSAPITVKTKNVTITDDGDPHTVYFCNDSRDSESGRGIIVCGGKTLTVRSSASGGISLVGHDPEGTRYNYSCLIYATTTGGAGKVYLTGISVSGCRTSASGALGTYRGTSLAASMYLSGCSITGNSSAGASGGAAVYNSGRLYLQGGTVITGNCTTSSVSGAVFCNESGEISISGSVDISGNLKNCIKAESGEVYPCGDPSDLYVSSASAVTCDASAAGHIGIDYPGDSERRFAQRSAAASADADAPFFSDINELYRARFHAGSKAVFWEDLFSFAPGASSAGSGLSYSFPGAALGSSASELSVSVRVDSGSIEIDPGRLPFDFSAYAITSSGLASPASPAAFSASEGICALTVTAEWSPADAQAFIRALRFIPKAYGAAQSVSFGFSSGGSASEYLFGGSTYEFIAEPASRNDADAAAVLSGGHLVCVSDPTVNLLVEAISGGEPCWTGGALLSDQWYFTDGTRYSASSVSSEGYEGAFVAWAENEPSSGSFMYASSGSWHSSSAGSLGYIIEKPVQCSAQISTTLSDPSLKTKLSSYSLELNGGIAVNYFFTFSPSFLSDSGAYVEVQIGDCTPVQYPVSDIAVPGNRAAHNSDSYRITVPVFPKDMNANTLIRFFTGSGSLCGYYGGEGHKNYNVRSYALTVIEKQHSGDSYNAGFSSDLVSLVKAMLNYGAAAEAQFSTAALHPANEGLVDDSPVTLPGNISGAYFAHDNADLSYSLSLYAQSDTLMRIVPSAAPSAALVDGVAADCSGGYVDIPVSMQDLGHVYSVSFSGSFEDTLQINVIKVIGALLESGSASEAARLTADRLYKMGLAADRYFGTYVPSASAVQAVLNTAYAYLAKTEYIQYDQNLMVSEGARFEGHPNSRRQLHASPQSAAECSSIFMDCSSFVYNVYREAFGPDAVQAALGGLGEEDMKTVNLYQISSGSLVASYECASLSFAQLYGLLQPGDLIVKYRDASSSRSAHGHVVLWTGNGYIHCTGSSYDYDNGSDKVEANGAVYFVPSSRFNESFYDGFDHLTVLRPLNLLGDADLLSEGTARQQLGGLSVSKTASLGSDMLFTGNGVHQGDVITFTIRIENPVLPGALNTTRTVDVSDTLPAGLSLDPGQSLSFPGVSAAPGCSAVLTYTATVTASAGSVIPASSGTCRSSAAGSAAGSISFAGLEISVEKPASAAVQSIIASADAMVGTALSSDAETVYSLIDGIYSDSLSSASILGTDPGGWVDGIFGSSEGWYYVHPQSSSLWSGLLVSNFASGRKVLNYSYAGGRFDTETRVRGLSSRSLMPGDLLCVYVPTKPEVYRYYVYTGSGNMAAFIAGETCRTVSADTTLDNLLNKTCFAVFRIAGRA